MVFETERLYLREMTQADYEALCRIMQDAEAMRLAYERVFTDNEVQGWLDRHIAVSYTHLTLPTNSLV